MRGVYETLISPVPNGHGLFVDFTDSDHSKGCQTACIEGMCSDVRSSLIEDGVFYVWFYLHCNQISQLKIISIGLRFEADRAKLQVGNTDFGENKILPHALGEQTFTRMTGQLEIMTGQLDGNNVITGITDISVAFKPIEKMYVVKYEEWGGYGDQEYKFVFKECADRFYKEKSCRIIDCYRRPVEVDYDDCIIEGGIVSQPNMIKSAKV